MSAPTDLRLLEAGRALIRAGDPPGLLSSVRTLARAMLALTDGEIGSERNGQSRDRRRSGELAQALHAERGRRAEFFPRELFGEPAWDILLDLYAAARSSQLRSVKAACLA